MTLHDRMPFRFTRFPEQARLRTIRERARDREPEGESRSGAARPPSLRPGPAPGQARSSPARLVPSGARFAVGAGAALESSFRDLTIPNVIRSMITLTGRAAAMEAV